MHDVSSDFKLAMEGKSPNIIRRFTIGTSDYSAFVIKWPKIGRKWNEIKPQRITINLANQNKTFNFFEGTPSEMNTNCLIDFGIEYAVGSEETINLFTGKINRMTFSNANVTIGLTDKIKPFSEVILGTSDVPLEFTNSDYLPSDVAWWLVTSYGGLSTVESTSNPDINFDSFSQWAKVFSDSSIFINAHFDGKKLNEAIRKIGKMTRSTIIVENNKLEFARYDSSSNDPFSVGSEFMYQFSIDIDEKEVINKQIVHAGFAVESRFYQYAVFDTDTPSVNSYGLHEELEEDPNVWYVNSASAFDLASRVIFTQKNPIKKYNYNSGIANSFLQVGDLVGINDGFHNVSGDTVRVMGYQIDLEKSVVKYEADASQILSFFILDDATKGTMDTAANLLG